MDGSSMLGPARGGGAFPVGFLAAREPDPSEVLQPWNTAEGSVTSPSSRSGGSQGSNAVAIFRPLAGGASARTGPPSPQGTAPARRRQRTNTMPGTRLAKQAPECGKMCTHSSAGTTRALSPHHRTSPEEQRVGGSASHTSIEAIHIVYEQNAAALNTFPNVHQFHARPQAGAAGH